MTSRYWNPRHETIPRERLEALQLRKLRNLVAWAHERVPFHAKRLSDAGVTAGSLRTLADLRRIPFFTREDWMDGQIAAPPYGPILACDPSVAMRYHLTSG